MTVNTEHFRATANLDRIRTRPFTTHNFEFNSSLLLQIYQHYTVSFFFQIHVVGPYLHIKCESFWKNNNNCWKICSSFTSSLC